MRRREESSRSRASRRPIACSACRDRKVRCSGTQPCNHCIRRGATCVFGQDDRKVTVSERFINDLKRRASRNEAIQNRQCRRQAYQNARDRDDDDHLVEFDQGPAIDQTLLRTKVNEIDSATNGPASSDLAVPPVVHDTCSAPELDTHMANPLDSGTSRFCVDTTGRRRFLGPSSTWAYTRHVIDEIKRYVKGQDSPEIPLYVDGNAYDFNWPTTGEAPLTKRELPSIDHAIYLMNTVKFHIAPLYHLYDEAFFAKGLNQFYNGNTGDIPNFNLWYIQYLIIIAFGKAFLLQTPAGRSPPGSVFFAQAMQRLPDVNRLYGDPFLSIEILCGISLYLQCIDQRNSAYVYLGIALRIALTQGLHRDIDNSELPEAPRARYRFIWWTLYILDRRFSSLMGAPVSINDADVTVTLPSTGLAVHRCEALAMHVELSRIITSVLNSVYGINGRLNRSFIKSVQEALIRLASLAPELESQFGFNGPNAEPVSRVAGTLNLCYHQCVILATRPVLVHVLLRKLSNPTDNPGISNPIKHLMKSCFESAEKSLRILTALKSQDLLEAFLPFDIDCAHSSAFVILLIKAIKPFHGIPEDDATQMECVGQIFNAVIQRGSVPAEYRHSELKVLYELLRVLALQTDASNESTSALTEAPRISTQRAVRDELGTEGDEIESQASFSQFVDAMGDTGLSSSEMLEVARLLEWGDVFAEDETMYSMDNICS